MIFTDNFLYSSEISELEFYVDYLTKVKVIVTLENI